MASIDSLNPRFSTANLPGGAWMVGRYLSVHQNLAKESSFNLDKAISQKTKGSIEIIKHKSDILVKTSNAASTQALLDTKTFGSKPVAFSVHHSLNFYRGIIDAPEASHLEPADIERTFDFEGQGVLSVDRVRTPESADPRLKSRRFIVTFDTKCRDNCDTIKLGDCVYPVRPYTPLPIRCNCCLRYGHVESSCKNPTPRCGKCSAKHSTKDCTSQTLKCAACGGAHSVDNRECPVWIQERKVNEIAETQKIPFDLARKKFRENEKEKEKADGRHATKASPSSACQSAPKTAPQPTAPTRPIRPLMEPLVPPPFPPPLMAPLRPAMPPLRRRNSYSNTYWRRWTISRGWEDLLPREPTHLADQTHPAPQAPVGNTWTWGLAEGWQCHTSLQPENHAEYPQLPPPIPTRHSGAPLPRRRHQPATGRSTSGSTRPPGKAVATQTDTPTKMTIGTQTDSNPMAGCDAACQTAPEHCTTQTQTDNKFDRSQCLDSDSEFDTELSGAESGGDTSSTSIPDSAETVKRFSLSPLSDSTKTSSPGSSPTLTRRNFSRHSVSPQSDRKRNSYFLRKRRSPKSNKQ